LLKKLRIFSHKPTIILFLLLGIDLFQELIRGKKVSKLINTDQCLKYTIHIACISKIVKPTSWRELLTDIHSFLLIDLIVLTVECLFTYSLMPYLIDYSALMGTVEYLFTDTSYIKFFLLYALFAIALQILWYFCSLNSWFSDLEDKTVVVFKKFVKI